MDTNDSKQEAHEQPSDRDAPAEDKDAESDEARDDDVDEASEQSFPASDPPAY